MMMWRRRRFRWKKQKNSKSNLSRTRARKVKRTKRRRRLIKRNKKHNQHKKLEWTLKQKKLMLMEKKRWLKLMNLLRLKKRKRMDLMMDLKNFLICIKILNLIISKNSLLINTQKLRISPQHNPSLLKVMVVHSLYKVLTIKAKKRSKKKSLLKLIKSSLKNRSKLP